MREDTYLKDNIKKCVDYVMNKNDDDKRRIITGMFQYNDYLINEQLLVKALNDKEKQEWFNNDMFDTYKLEIERLNNDYLEMKDNFRVANDEIERLQKLLDIEKNKRKQFDKDNQKLHSIIKEVREYIENGYLSDGEMVNILAKQELLEILDKLNEGEQK